MDQLDQGGSYGLSQIVKQIALPPWQCPGRCCDQHGEYDQRQQSAFCGGSEGVVGD
jgi:hypothetical protein